MATNRTKETLRGYFNTGDVPSQDNFHDLIESKINTIDTSQQNITSDLSLSGSLLIGTISESGGSNGFIQMSASISSSGDLIARTGSYSYLKANVITASILESENLKVGNSPGQFGAGELTVAATSFGFGSVVNFELAGQDTFGLGVIHPNKIGTPTNQPQDIGTGNFSIFSGSNGLAGTGAAQVNLFISRSNGNVGIDTVHPSEKLSVHGNIHVSGSGLGHITASGVISASGTGFNIFAGHVDSDGFFRAGNGYGLYGYNNAGDTGKAIALINSSDNVLFSNNDCITKMFGSSILLDSAGALMLDSDTGTIQFRDGGFTRIEFDTTSGDIEAKGSVTASGDISGSSSGSFANVHISQSLSITGLPTTNPEVVGAIYNDGGILKVSDG